MLQWHDRPLQPCDIDLGDLLRAAAAVVASFVETRKLDFQLDLPPDLGTVYAEPDGGSEVIGVEAGERVAQQRTAGCGATGGPLRGLRWSELPSNKGGREELG